MNLIWQFVIGWMVFIGLVGFVTMGIDKSRAQAGEWRIPERALLCIALAGGAFGLVLGSGVLHHKTHKNPFIGVALFAAVVWVAVLLELQKVLGPP